MTGRRLIEVSLALVLVVGAGVATASSQGRTGRLAGRPLPDVLGELGRQGAPLVFSSRLVRPDMKVAREPHGASLRSIVEQILEPHGLRIVAGPAGRWLVVAEPLPAAAAAGPVMDAKETGTVRVSFRRQGSGRELLVARVTLFGDAGVAAVSPDGHVVITGLPVGTHYLEATVPGHAQSPPVAAFVARGRVLNVRVDLVPIALGVTPDPTALPSVAIAATRGLNHREVVDVFSPAGAPAPGAPTVSMAATELMKGAGNAGNLLAPLQTLPGVKAARDFDGRLVVRGGATNQNLVLLDGVEVMSPYHAFGMTSAFLPEAVEAVQLSPGGFDVEHGDRLSSVISVGSRNGAHDGLVHGAGGVGLFETDVMATGPVPRLPAGSWVVAGRYSYVDLVASSVLEDLVPRFGDLHARLAGEPRPGWRVWWLGLVGRERSDYRENDDVGEDWMLRTRARTAVVSQGVEGLVGSRATWRTLASVSSVADGTDMRGRMATDAWGTADSEPDGRLADIAFGRHAAVRDWSVRHEWTVGTPAPDTWSFGAEAHWLTARWRLQATGDRNPALANRSLPWPYGLPGASLPSQVDSRARYGRTAAWAQHRRTLGGRLTVQGGLRVDRSSLTRQAVVLPRAALTMRVGPRSRMVASAGAYSQSPGYEKLLLADDFVDLSAGHGLRSERAFHTALGLELDLALGVFGRVEVYGKSYKDLIVGRLETDAELAARLARYDFGDLVDRVPASAQITTIPTNGASGLAYGLDAQVTRVAASDEDRLSGWLSYSYSVAQRRAYGYTTPFEYDRRHVVGAVGQVRLHPAIMLSGTVRFASGAPWTDPAGLQIAAREDRADTDGDGNVTEFVPARTTLGQLVYTHDPGDLSRTNSARLPAYARVDARVTFRPGGPRGRWTFLVDFVNLLNRENPGLVTCRVGGTSANGTPVFFREPDFSVPLLPSVGVRFTF